MKKIGIVGGLSPASTLAYYQLLTQLWRERSRGQSLLIHGSGGLEQCR